MIKLDGSTPVKYGLRLPMDATYDLLKERLSAMCGVSSEHLLLAEILGAMIKVIASRFLFIWSIMRLFF